MQRQGSFSQAEYAGKKKQTRRDKFLAEMERVVPWARLVERLRPFYPKGERGRPPIGLERMLRLYFLQQWYGLADEALEDALYDSQALRGFAGIDLSVTAVPDATTRDRVDPAVGERRPHQREVLGGDQEGALAGVDVGGLVGVEVDASVSHQQPRHRLVAAVRRTLRGEHLLVDLQVAAGEPRQPPRAGRPTSAPPYGRGPGSWWRSHRS